jgi:hypothetical protein
VSIASLLPSAWPSAELLPKLQVSGEMLPLLGDFCVEIGSDFFPLRTLVAFAV